MKTKAILSILMLAIAISTFSQKATLELTFTAEDNGQYVTLDSIFIENLTQGGDTTLYAPDTVLVIDYVSGIGDNETNGNNTFTISQNYPNPFKGKTDINLYLSEKESIKIIVRDILGRELSQYENILNRGNHSFVFYAGDEKYNLLTVSGNQTSKTIKMLNASSNPTNGGKCKLVYNKYEDNVIGFKSQNSISNFVFSMGDKLNLTAYSEVGERSFVDVPIGDQLYIIQYTGNSCPSSPIVTDIDGNIYKTVLMGTQCWMAENLKTTTYQSGTPIPNITVNSEWGDLITGAYCWHDNDISWKDLYGALYNWWAVTDPNGLCPAGWHEPSVIEWDILENFVGGWPSPHGNELKSCRQVDSPLGGDCSTSDHPRWDQDDINHGTDDYYFSGLPGGARYTNGQYVYFGKHCNWWTSTPGSINEEGAYMRILQYDIGEIWRGINLPKEHGYSMRCLKD